MRKKDSETNLYITVKGLLLVLLISGGLNIALVSLAFELKKEIPVSVPPDLRTGALLRAGEKQPEDIFSFATTMFMAVNNWRDAGELDYATNIDRLDDMFTPNFTRYLEDDIAQRRKHGQLKGRTRLLTLPPEYVFNEDNITVINSSEWLVKVPLEVREYVDNQIVKDVEVLYSLIVKRVRSAVMDNPYQLAIDGFRENPIRTKDYLSQNIVKQDVDLLMEQIQ